MDIQQKIGLFRYRGGLMMQRMDLQKQATMLIEQLSTEKLEEVVHYLAALRDKDARNASPLPDGEIPQKGLGTLIHGLFKHFGGVELHIPPRESMRETPRFDV